MTEATPTAQRYRKVPVVIEAMQYERDPGPVIEWINGNGGNANVAGRDELGPVVIIPTLEGPMFTRRGDWVIRGVAGEFYPCKPEIFDETYEEAAPEPVTASKITAGTITDRTVKEEDGEE